MPNCHGRHPHFAFAVYIFRLHHAAWLTHTLFPNGRLFPSTNAVTNIGIILRTIALIYAAYVGLVIADERKVKAPAKTSRSPSSSAW